MSPTPTPVPTTGNDHGWPQEWGTREAFPENPMARNSPGQGTAVPFAGRKSSPVFKAQGVRGASQQLQAQPGQQWWVQAGNPMPHPAAVGSAVGGGCTPTPCLF